MSITSDEVNFLVYRYLQESGKRLGFRLVANAPAAWCVQKQPPWIEKPG